MPDSTWIVRPSKFPFGVSSTELGRVTASDHGAAAALARARFGRHVVLERVVERDAPSALNTAEVSPIPGEARTRGAAPRRRQDARPGDQRSLGLREAPKPPRGPQGGRAA